MNAEIVSQYLAARVRGFAPPPMNSIPVRTETAAAHEAENHMLVVAEEVEEMIPGNRTFRVKGRALLVQFCHLANAATIAENQSYFAEAVTEALNVPLYAARLTPEGEDPYALPGWVMMKCECAPVTIGTDGTAYVATAAWEAVAQF